MDATSSLADFNMDQTGEYLVDVQPQNKRYGEPVAPTDVEYVASKRQRRNPPHRRRRRSKLPSYYKLCINEDLLRKVSRRSYPPLLPDDFVIWRQQTNPKYFDDVDVQMQDMYDPRHERDSTPTPRAHDQYNSDISQGDTARHDFQDASTWSGIDKEVPAGNLDASAWGGISKKVPAHQGFQEGVNEDASAWGGFSKKVPAHRGFQEGVNEDASAWGGFSKKVPAHRGFQEGVNEDASAWGGFSKKVPAHRGFQEGINENIQQHQNGSTGRNEGPSRQEDQADLADDEDDFGDGDSMWGYEDHPPQTHHDQCSDFEFVCKRLKQTPNTPATFHDLLGVIKVTRPVRNPEATLPTPNASPKRPAKTRRTKRQPQGSEDEDRCYDRVQRDPFEVRLQGEMRDYCDLTLLKLTKVKPMPLSTPTTEEIERFCRDPHRHPGPDLASLRLHLNSKNWESSVWNLAAADLIADEFVQDEQYQCKNKKMARRAFMKHLRQLRDRYRTQEWQMTNDKEAEVNEAQSLRSLRRTNRRRSLRERRIKGIRAYQRITKKADQLEKLNQFEKLLSQMPLDAMSGDESDRGVFVIKRLPWRSLDAKVSEWFRVLDGLYLSTRFTDADKPTAGAFPGQRLLPNDILHDANPVPHLPINFYDQTYLDKLDEYEMARLAPQKAMDLIFPPQLQFVAARFGGVHSGNRKPLPRNHPSLRFNRTS